MPSQPQPGHSPAQPSLAPWSVLPLPGLGLALLGAWCLVRSAALLCSFPGCSPILPLGPQAAQLFSLPSSPCQPAFHLLPHTSAAAALYTARSQSGTSAARSPALGQISTQHISPTCFSPHPAYRTASHNPHTHTHIPHTFPTKPSHSSQPRHTHTHTHPHAHTHTTRAHLSR